MSSIKILKIGKTLPAIKEVEDLPCNILQDGIDTDVLKGLPSSIMLKVKRIVGDETSKNYTSTTNQLLKRFAKENFPEKQLVKVLEEELGEDIGNEIKRLMKKGGCIKIKNGIKFVSAGCGSKLKYEEGGEYLDFDWSTIEEGIEQGIEEGTEQRSDQTSFSKIMSEATRNLEDYESRTKYTSSNAYQTDSDPTANYSVTSYKKGNGFKDAIKSPGSFTDYCKSIGYRGVTEECIEEGKEFPNKLTRKRANLASTFRNFQTGGTLQGVINNLAKTKESTQQGGVGDINNLKTSYTEVKPEWTGPGYYPTGQNAQWSPNKNKFIKSNFNLKGERYLSTKEEYDVAYNHKQNTQTGIQLENNFQNTISNIIQGDRTGTKTITPGKVSYKDPTLNKDIHVGEVQIDRQINVEGLKKDVIKLIGNINTYAYNKSGALRTEEDIRSSQAYIQSEPRIRASLKVMEEQANVPKEQNKNLFTENRADYLYNMMYGTTKAAYGGTLDVITRNHIKPELSTIKDRAEYIEYLHSVQDSLPEKPSQTRGRKHHLPDVFYNSESDDLHYPSSKKVRKAQEVIENLKKPKQKDNFKSSYK